MLSIRVKDRTIYWSNRLRAKAFHVFLRLKAWITKMYQYVNVYLFDSWGMIPFQMLLYTFIFAAGISLWVIDAPLPPLEILAPHIYWLWLSLCILCPVIALLSWFCIMQFSGRWKYRGYWFRLAGDSGMFFALLAFHLSIVMTRPEITEARVFSRFWRLAVIAFVFVLVIRDIWSIIITEKTARKLGCRE